MILAAGGNGGNEKLSLLARWADVTLLVYQTFLENTRGQSSLVGRVEGRDTSCSILRK